MIIEIGRTSFLEIGSCVILVLLLKRYSVYSKQATKIGAYWIRASTFSFSKEGYVVSFSVSWKQVTFSWRVFESSFIVISFCCLCRIQDIVVVSAVVFLSPSFWLVLLGGVQSEMIGNLLSVFFFEFVSPSCVSSCPPLLIFVFLMVVLALMGFGDDVLLVIASGDDLGPLLLLLGVLVFLELS